VTVLVIGSNGQDGSILCDLLKARNESYVAVSRTATCFSDGTSMGRVDLSKTSEATDLLNIVKPTAIVHLAAVHAPSGSMVRLGDEKFDEMIKCHVDISKNVLDWQLENPDSKSIFALSSQMFSMAKQDPLINLNSEVNPTSKYGETKAICWEMLKRYRFNQNVNTVGLILFNHTSERSKPDFLFHELARQITNLVKTKKGTVKIRDANAYIDIHSAYDLGNGIIKTIENDEAQDFIFSSGKYFKIQEIIQEALLRLDMSHTVDIVSTNQSTAEIPLHGDISKTRNILDWTPKATPSEILLSMIN
jgi:nucleoside-diphosphate-sugar epimerase